MKIFRLIFGKIDMFSNFVTQAFNVMGTILIIFVMIVVNADVIGRELFLSPIAGVPMMVSMSIVAIVFLQTPQTFRQGRLTQNEAILNSIGNRNLFIKLFNIYYIFTIIICLGHSIKLFCIFFTYYYCGNSNTWKFLLD